MKITNNRVTCINHETLVHLRVQVLNPEYGKVIFTQKRTKPWNKQSMKIRLRPIVD